MCEQINFITLLVALIYVSSTKLHVIKKRMHSQIWSVVLFYAFMAEKWREVTDLQRQIEKFVYTQVAIQTGDAGTIRKLRERVQLK